MNSQTLNTVTPLSTGAATFPVSLGNIVGTLAFVLVLIVAVAWILRRSGVVSHVVKGNHILSVKHSQSIGTRERLVVVEIDNKWLLLGVTQENITRLMTMDKQESPASTPLASGFHTALLNCIKPRTGGSQQ